MDINSGGLFALISNGMEAAEKGILYYAMLAALLAASYCLGALPVKKLAKGGLPAFLLQTVKTAVAVCIGGLFFGFKYAAAVSVGDELYGAGFFSMLGQMYPLFGDRRNATRGEAAFLAFALILAPFCGLISGAIFLLMLLLAKYLSLAYVTGAIMFPVVLYGYFTVCFGAGSMRGLASLFCIIAAVLAVFAYRVNLERISEKTEPRFSFFRKDDDK